MTPKEFTDGIYEEINRSLDAYRRGWSSAEIDRIENLSYKKAVSFYKNLDREQQEVLIELIKQIQIDNTATILALIDGVYYLKTQENDFKLIYQSEPETVISGDLSNIFLETVEVEQTSPPEII